MIKLLCDGASDLYGRSDLKIIGVLSPMINNISECDYSKHLWWSLYSSGVKLKSSQVTEYQLLSQISNDIELGYNEFIVVTINSAVSGFYNNCAYLEKYPPFEGIRIKFIDSRQVSYCFGMPLLECQDRILKYNYNFDQAIEFLENELPRYSMYYIIPTTTKSLNGKVETSMARNYSVLKSNTEYAPSILIGSYNSYYEARRKILNLTRDKQFLGKIRSDYSIKNYIGEFGGSLIATAGTGTVGYLFKN